MTSLALDPRGTAVSRLNLFPDPKFASNGTTAMTVGAAGGTGTLANVVSSPASEPSITRCLRWQVTTVSTGSPFNFYSTGTGTAALPVTGGTTYTLSSWFRVSHTISGARILPTWYNSAGVELTAVSGTVQPLAPGDGWKRLAETYTAPADAAFMRLLCSFSGPTTVPVGGFFYVTGILVEPAATLGTYFDGSTTDVTGIDYVWNGTTNASSSSAIVPDPDTYVIPRLMLGYTTSRPTRTVVRPILGTSDPAYTVREAGLRTGTLSFLFDNLTDALRGEIIHSRPGRIVLSDPDVPAQFLRYVATNDVALRLDDETRAFWILDIAFQEVA